MKFKKGDKVKVVANKHGHKFKIGEIITIGHVSNDNNNYMASSKTQDWCVEDNELVIFKKEPMKNPFKKKKKRPEGIDPNGFNLIFDNGQGTRWLITVLEKDVPKMGDHIGDLSIYIHEFLKSRDIPCTMHEINSKPIK